MPGLSHHRCVWALCAIVALWGEIGCRSAPKPPQVAAAPPPAPITAMVERLPPVEQTADVRLASAIEPVNEQSRSQFDWARPAELVAPGPAPPVAGANAWLLRLSLFDAIETGLIQNPDLTAQRQLEGVSVGALGVARTYPFNPFLQITATPWQDRIDHGPTVVYHYVLVMQTLQIAHQQRYREDVGMAQLTSVRWNILQAELNNIAQTERLYFTAAYLRGVRDLLVANAELNETLLVISERQLQAGQAAGSAVAIVRLATGATRRQARLAEANYQTALRDLRRQLYIPLATPIDVSDDLSQFGWQSAAPDRLLAAKCSSSMQPIPHGVSPRPTADLVAGRPDGLAARADVSAARSAAQLARASRVPDLVVGPYYQRTESGTYYYGFRTQNDIPVINNGNTLLRQRQAEARQRQVAAEQIMLRAEIEAEAAIDRYERARRLLSEFEPGSTAAVPAELQRLEWQFTANEVDILRVFTSRTSLIQMRRSQLDLLNEAAQAAANVTAATAAPPQAIIALPAPH